MSIKGDRNRLKGSELKKWDESKLWDSFKRVLKKTVKTRKVEK